MKFALARAARGGQPRFFAGRYDHSFSRAGLPTPITTGAPDQAHTYDDQDIAEVMVRVFNAFDGLEYGTPQSNWIVMPLPEQWS